jgi:phenylacetate-CoA ligase
MTNLKEKYIKKLILPLSDLVLKRSISKHLKFLEKSQFWSLDELERFQNERLRLLIKHAVINVPYYTKLFLELGLTYKDIQTKEDLQKLPILTKQDIKNNFPEFIVNKHLKKGSYYKGASSGSTGEPLNYFLSKEAYSFNIACGLRAWSWMGYKLGDKYIKISQNQRSKKEKKIQDKLMNNDYLFLKNIDKSSISEAIEMIKEAKPKIIRCYPDPLEFIADELIARNEFIPLKAIATTGNMLHDEARKKIEFAFKTKIFDGYSCEGSAPYFQCETHENYHAGMEYAISEFVDVEENENGFKQGRHIVTNLWNFDTPFIRYDSQDLLEFSGEKCSCGRNLLPIKRILGRDNDVLETPNGKKIIVHIFTIFFSKMPSVKQFQFIQEDEKTVNGKLIVHETFTTEDFSKVTEHCKHVFDDSMSVNIKLVGSIPTTKNGKRRFLINRMK